MNFSLESTHTFTNKPHFSRDGVHLLNYGMKDQVKRTYHAFTLLKKESLKWARKSSSLLLESSSQKNRSTLRLITHYCLLSSHAIVCSKISLIALVLHFKQRWKPCRRRRRIKRKNRRQVNEMFGSLSYLKSHLGNRNQLGDLHLLLLISLH